MHISTHRTFQPFHSLWRVWPAVLCDILWFWLDYLTWEVPRPSLGRLGRSFDLVTLEHSCIWPGSFTFFNSPREQRREPTSRRRRRSSITVLPPPRQARTPITFSEFATSKLRSITLSFTLPICPEERRTHASPEAWRSRPIERSPLPTLVSVCFDFHEIVHGNTLNWSSVMSRISNS